MPELPEVETTRRGLERLIVGKRVRSVLVRQRALRCPISEGVERALKGQEIMAIGRRAKYLIFKIGDQQLLAHLGMSGSMSVVQQSIAPKKHDHFELRFDDGSVLRYHDPRRFGAILLCEKGTHKLLEGIGPEPLSKDFDVDRLYDVSRGRKICLRDFLLDSKVVAGIGNIYASEAAFMAGIDPRRQAGRISAARYQKLHGEIRRVLKRAIQSGGTTLKDFSKVDGKAGYFQIKLAVYGKEGQACQSCDQPIRREVVGQRSLFFCIKCQK